MSSHPEALMETDEGAPGRNGRSTGGARAPFHPGEPLHVTARVEAGGVAVLSVRGELDIAAEAPLREVVGTAVAGGVPEALFDLSGVTFCDTSGMRVLHLCGQDARALGGRLVLIGLSERMLWLLEISGLGRGFAPVLRVSGRAGLPCRSPARGERPPFPFPSFRPLPCRTTALSGRAVRSRAS
ncbi:hypothetical protein GCM10017673_45960 [Streptosporangium violaceochromogenes]|nr:hypothetical protein GCM10017673_45960 [Streptosporangium violaceochromogenes]